MIHTQSQKSARYAPDFKKEILEKIRMRIGQNTIREITRRTNYHINHVRRWANSYRVNKPITDAAFNLLRELEQEEQQNLKRLNKEK